LTYAVTVYVSALIKNLYSIFTKYIEQTPGHRFKKRNANKCHSCSLNAYEEAAYRVLTNHAFTSRRLSKRTGRLLLFFSKPCRSILGNKTRSVPVGSRNRRSRRQKCEADGGLTRKDLQPSPIFFGVNPHGMNYPGFRITDSACSIMGRVYTLWSHLFKPMKPYKRLACLVTLIIACGHPLSADTVSVTATATTSATATEFRSWVDVRGRTIAARFVRMVSPTTVEIEHKDTKLLYSVPVAQLSANDQKYIAEASSRAAIAALNAANKDNAVLKDADEAVWTLLQSAGSQSSLQTNMQFGLMLELINKRLAVQQIVASSGETLSIRTEPAELAERISVPRDMPRMSMDKFVTTVAEANSIAVKVDSAGLIVLIDKALDNHLNDPKPTEYDFYKNVTLAKSP
jgi:hypothetical protein